MHKKINPINNISRLNNNDFNNKNFNKKSNNNSYEFLKILIKIMHDNKNLSFDQIASTLNKRIEVIEEIYNK